MAGRKIALSRNDASNQEDEDDFMSDKFLAKLSDVRPGLHQQHRHGSASKRPFGAAGDSGMETQPKKLSQRQQAAESLRLALATPLEACTGDPDTGGSGGSATARMMARMGYQPGQGLGRLGQGMLEPLPLHLKSDRAGLGHNRSRGCNRAASTKPPAVVDAVLATDDFRRQMSAKFARIGGLSDLSRAQRACRQLDMSAAAAAAPTSAADGECGVCPPPPAAWYWPQLTDNKSTTTGRCADEDCEGSSGEDGDGDNNEEPSPHEQLSIIVQHLRACHHYCLWCGRQFDSAADMADECPGPDREHHQADDNDL